MAKKPFRVVGSSPELPEFDPAVIPVELKTDGRMLWQVIMREYAIDDSGGVEMLFQIAMTRDRLTNIQEQIAKDGVLVKTKTGVKEHPLLKAELAYRAFIVRALQKLGIGIEPTKAVGRPPTFA